MNTALYVSGLCLLVFIAIGLASNRYFSKSAEGFYLGDRDFGPIPTALSVGASDSSGWVFTGAVGFAYAYGVSMMWICIGYTIGMFCNYIFVAPALRRYTRRTGATSVPHYFALRFPDEGKKLRAFASVVIVVFFVVYTAAQLTSAGKSFEAVVGWDYGRAVWAAAFISAFYTLLGGYRAVVWTDVVQGAVIIAVLFFAPLMFITYIGGWHAFWERAYLLDPRLLTFASGLKGHDGAAFAFGLAAGGLGLLGQPHILQRFITARDDATLITSAVIGVAWVLIQTSGSTLLGVICRVMMPAVPDPEFAFPLLVVRSLDPLAAGIVLAAVFSAILSTLDSLIVLVAQTVQLDIIEGVFGRKLPERSAALAGRAVVAAVGVFGAFIALQHQRIVFWFVLYAFAVMGASFAPPLILSLFCRRITGRGVLCGMAAGAAVTIAWYNTPPLKGFMYELFPAFIASAAVTAAVSLFSRAPEDAERHIELTKR